MDTNIFNQPEECHVPKCHYCGRFIGKNDDFEIERIYGMFSPDRDILYHKKCKNDADNEYVFRDNKERKLKFLNSLKKLLIEYDSVISIEENWDKELVITFGFNGIDESKNRPYIPMDNLICSQVIEHDDIDKLINKITHE